MESAEKVYKNRHKKYFKLYKNQKKKSSFFSNLRLLSALLAVFGFISPLFFPQIAGLENFIGLAFVILFIVFIVIHGRVKEKEKYLEVIANLNNQGLERLKGNWRSFEDQGDDYVDEHHFFTYDLDIFGKNSLYQWINTTTTFLGREKFAKVLKNPPQDIELIKMRQDAIKELAENIDFRQNLQGYGLLSKETLIDPKGLIEWTKEKTASTFIYSLLQFFPILTLAAAYISYSTNVLAPFAIAAILQTLIAILIFSNAGSQLQRLGRYKDQIAANAYLLEMIESYEFKSPLLSNLQNRMARQGKASDKLRRLEKVMSLLSVRFQQWYFLFNILTLWDTHCILGLNNWKDKHGVKVDVYLEVIASFDELSSFAVLNFENSDWVTPQLTKKPQVKGQNVGHPLIDRNERVGNDIFIGPKSPILMITGSNMSGKSTYLRTVGFNSLLAYCGANVCAKDFRISPMKISTSMRVQDDINSNVSSFYAELKRVRTILQQAKEGNKVLFLLDEIFKGTNSKDRHAGAKALIKELYTYEAMGLVSTHDLELAELENEIALKNYHFTEHYVNEDIRFDYKLRSGVSQTFNAKYLMKKMGINV
ncbi:DNA mismatch repair protein MutS [Proteinivorax hydrogeniformans]|uniref:DNA mismatch repair protein MutS n=1 Tax=Proteinivorax hydrogeniformans TaxID=1826727 RepID=A0AAU8HW67_9FIRM